MYRRVYTQTKWNIAMTARPVPGVTDQLETALIDIAEHHDRGSWDRQDALVSLAIRYSAHDAVRAMVNEVCTREPLMDACVRGSEIHPLGFDKFLLWSSSSYHVRLHIWWKDHGQRREDIHNHRFSFSSAVVIGSIRVYSYRLGRGGVIMTRRAEHKDENGIYEYTMMGSVGVHQISTLALTQGNSYYMDASQLHRVEVPDNNAAATLFITARNERRDTTVVSIGSAKTPRVGTRNRLTKKEIRDRLKLFLDLIS
jgi:hypothetical protein